MMPPASFACSRPPAARRAPKGPRRSPERSADRLAHPAAALHAHHRYRAHTDGLRLHAWHDWHAGVELDVGNRPRHLGGSCDRYRRARPQCHCVRADTVPSRRRTCLEMMVRLAGHGPSDAGTNTALQRHVTTMATKTSPCRHATSVGTISASRLRGFTNGRSPVTSARARLSGIGAADQPARPGSA